MARKKINILIEKKKRYLECPYCNNVQNESLHKDPTSAWCSKCGRCFPVNWKEE